jgi:hypothetical protein
VRILGAIALVATATSAVGAADVTPTSPCDPIGPFSYTNFHTPIKIDNEFLPLEPGTRFTLQGRANRTGQLLDHQVIFTVTDLTMVIHGVRSRVMHDVDMNNGKMIEEELSFFAQDDAGNVWNTGEYPEEYDANGNFAGAPRAWFSGLDFAVAGVHMLADPKPEAPPYLQGDAPVVHFQDCGQVYQEDQHVDVPHASFDGVLVIREWAPLQTGQGFQLKYHAPFVGIVKVGAIDDPEGETLELVERRMLSAAELAEVRAKSLKVDKHGRDIRHPLYIRTQPISTTVQRIQLPTILRLFATR